MRWITLSLIVLLWASVGFAQQVVRPGRIAPSSGVALAFAPFNISASGDTSLVGATADQTIRLYRLLLSNPSSMTVTLKCGSTVLLVATSHVVLDLNADPWFTCGVNEALILNAGTAQQVTGTVAYTKN